MADVQTPFLQSAGAQSAFAQGFGDALQALVSQGTNEQLQFLQAHGTPEAALQAVQEAGGNLSNIVYGREGWIPGQEMGMEGAAWQAFMNAAPTFSQQQLQQDAQIPNRQIALQQLQMQLDAQTHAAQMASQARMSAAEAAQRSSSSEGGLTAYQQLQAEQDERDFAYQVAKDERDFELEMKKFEQAMAGDAQANEEFMMTFGRLLGLDEQEQSNWETGRQDDLTAAERAARSERRDRREGYVKELRGGILASIKEANPRLSKAELKEAVLGQITTLFEPRFGYSAKKIENLVNSIVNTNYLNYKKGWPKVETPASSGGGKITNSQIASALSNGWNSIKDNFDPNNLNAPKAATSSPYQFARTRMVASIKADLGPRYFKKNRAKLIARINATLARYGIRPKK